MLRFSNNKRIRLDQKDSGQRDEDDLLKRIVILKMEHILRKHFSMFLLQPCEKKLFVILAIVLITRRDFPQSLKTHVKSSKTTANIFSHL